MDAFHRQRQVVEVIWTGPTSDTGTLRKTEQALLQLIDDANHSLWILTFVAYKAEPVMDAIERAVARGVKVSMVAESERSSEGRTAFAAADAMRESLAGLIVIYEWPAAQRDRDQAGNSGTLHAKGALADERVLLVSSANLTDHALRLNIELGVLIRGGEHPGRLAQHLNQLVATGVLRPCSCP
jgi:phosphatidylserine/phosphatidylglycerophosphate/cardiolipin synthase-like enzyme